MCVVVDVADDAEDVDDADDDDDLLNDMPLLVVIDDDVLLVVSGAPCVSIMRTMWLAAVAWPPLRRCGRDGGGDAADDASTKSNALV